MSWRRLTFAETVLAAALASLCGILIAGLVFGMSLGEMSLVKSFAVSFGLAAIANDIGCRLFAGGDSDD